MTTTEDKLATPNYTTFYASDITSTSFVAHWGAVSGATQYYVNIREVGGQYPSSPTGGTVGTSYKFENLKPGTSYEFQVRAINNSQKSDWSKSIANPVKTVSESKPATPDNATFYASDISTTSFVAHWGAVSGATQYYLNIREVGGQYPSSPTGGSVGTSYKFENLKPGTSYEFQVRAINNSQKSDWSKSIENPVKTMSSSTSIPKLIIYQIDGFNSSSSLIVNNTYHYKVLVLNNGNFSWTGSFYLKDGNNNIKDWNGISMQKNVAQPLECDYTPTTTGNKALVLYYQTGGKGEYIPVSTKSTSDNIMQVNVTEQKASPVYDLKLSNAMTYPSSINWGNKTTISANIVNSSSETWTGTLYLTDNGISIAADPTTLAKGQKYTIKCDSWSPTTAETHTISAYFKTDGDSDWRQVAANGYTIPAYIAVTNVNVPETAQDAVLKLITKDCAPSYVNEGDQVFYHYRITDNNGNPLQGMKAQFKCTGSSLKNMVETTTSDLGGYAVLCLETTGDNAFANRGEFAKFVCSGFVDSNNKSVSLHNTNANDTAFSLGIYKGVNHYTEGIESFDLTIDRGISGEAKLASFASASAGLSFPLTTSFIFNDNQLLTRIDSEAKGELKGKAGYKDIIGGSLGGELGLKESVTYNWNSPQKTALAMMMSLFDASELFTSSHTMRSIMAIESWFGIEKGEGFYDDILENQSTSMFWGTSLGLNYNSNAIKYWPINYGVNPGTLFPDLKIPLDQAQLNGSFSGEASFKCEPEIVNRDYSSSKVQYGTSRQLKAKINVDINKVFNSLSPSNGTIFNPIPEKNLATYMGQYERSFNKSWGGGASVVMSTKEEEMYTTESRQTLDKISNSLQTEASFKLSTSSLREYLCPEWCSANEGKQTLSLGGSIAWKWKISSKGAFASDLQKLAKYSPQIVSTLYPALNHKNTKYIIEAPHSFVSLMKGNTLDNALRFVTLQPMFSGKTYDVKDAFKIETQETNKVFINASIPLAKWEILGVGIDVTLDCGLSLDVAYYPTESYYSVSDKRYCPVVIRNNRTLSSLIKNLTEDIKDRFNRAFGIEDKKAISNHAGKVFDLQESQLSSMIKELSNKNKPHNTGGGTAWTKRRAKRLIGVNQEDICTFAFSVNDQTQNFDEGTNISLSHFYPMGKLLGITDQNDTLFVVSEVFDLKAVQGTDTLKTTKNGKIKLETHVGADDLTPFGFSLNTPMAIYQAEPGSSTDSWHYVGQAGTDIMVDKLGYYMIATSIKNDMIAPEIFADLYTDTGILHFNVTDNIAIRTNSFKVYVNGEVKDATMLSESIFEVQLNSEELNYKLDINVSVYDLAGNKTEIRQIFQIDKPEKPLFENSVPETDISQLDNIIYITRQNGKPGDMLTIPVNMKNSIEVEGFNFDLYLPDGISFLTDSDGFPEVYLSNERTTDRKTSTFEANIMPDGNLRVLAASTKGYTISGNDGEVVTLKVKIADDIKPGKYPLILREIALSDNNAQSYDTDEVISSITISEMLKGDVNLDGKVDINDVVAIINQMAGIQYYENANVNEDSDGVVDINDVVAVINIMAGK